MNFAVCVLIVEDDPQKQEVIRLSVINHTPNAEVHVATSVASGRRAVREKFFDLVLLDLLLPLADGNSVPSRTGGLTLLELLHTDDTVLQPRYVVGITSFDLDP
jgi:CheY-like chemotaxis protein